MRAADLDLFEGRSEFGVVGRKSGVGGTSLPEIASLRSAPFTLPASFEASRELELRGPPFTGFRMLLSKISTSSWFDLSLFTVES